MTSSKLHSRKQIFINQILPMISIIRAENNDRRPAQFVVIRALAEVRLFVSFKRQGQNSR